MKTECTIVVLPTQVVALKQSLYLYNHNLIGWDKARLSQADGAKWTVGVEVIWKSYSTIILDNLTLIKKKKKFKSWIITNCWCWGRGWVCLELALNSHIAYHYSTDELCLVTITLDSTWTNEILASRVFILNSIVGPMNTTHWLSNVRWIT